MITSDLTRRLDRIEARRGSDTITGLLNLAGFPAEIAKKAVRDWRTWVADGVTLLCGDTLVLRGDRSSASSSGPRATPRTSAAFSRPPTIACRRHP